MKVTHNKPTFSPVTVSFTFETQDELDKVAAMFNSCFFVDSLVEMGVIGHSAGIYKVFEETGADIDTHVALVNNVFNKHFRRF